MEDVTRASDDLLDTLHQTEIIIEKLIRFSREKESLLSSENVVGLNELLLTEEDTATAFRENEAVRKTKTCALASAVGISTDDLKLTAIINAVECPSCREKLAKTRVEVAEKLEILVKQNTKVKELLHNKINYVNFMINLLFIPKNSLYSYDIQGNKEDEVNKLNFLDYRV